MAEARDEYKIVARIVAEDATAPGADAAERRLVEVEDRASQVGSSITGLFGRMFALLAGAGGFGRIAEQIVGMNAAIETATNGLATLYSAIGGVTISEGVTLARDEIRALQADAKAGVGELSNYIEGYQKMLGPGLNAGQSLEQLRELNRNALAAGAALRGEQGLWMTPMDITQALTSGAGDKTTPIVSAALGAAGMGLSEFNALDQAAKFDALNRAFRAFGPGVQLMGQSWEAQASTFRDTLKDLFRTVSTPLFERWKEGLVAANQLLTASQDKLATMTQVWGGRLVAIWDHLVDRAGTYASLLTAAAVAQGAGGLGMGLQGGGLAGMARIGGAGAMFAGGAGIGPALGHLFAPLLQVVSRLAWPLALVALVLESVRGAFAEFPQLLDSMKEKAGVLFQSFGLLGDAFASLTGGGSLLNMTGALIIKMFEGLVVIFAVAVRALATLVTGFGVMLRLIGSIVKMTAAIPMSLFTDDWEGGGGPAADMAAKAGRDFETATKEGQDLLAATWLNWSPEEGLKQLESALGGKGGAELKPRGVGNTVINGNINVQVKAERIEDPMRVAASFETVLGSLKRSRTQALRLTSGVG